MKRTVAEDIEMAAAGIRIAVAAEAEVSHNSAQAGYRAAVDIRMEAAQILNTAIPDREVVVLLAVMVLGIRMAGMGVAAMTSGTEAVVLDMAIVRMGET
jgi:hypothetical protein